ncbi:MAG: FemAB family XrtA/PEP-CTERM system-associated protein [bacterium]
MVETMTSGFEAWDEFVSRQAEARGPHLSSWKQVIEKSFGHPCYYLAARENGRLRGILPLSHLRSKLFGSFLISMPYLNYGGVLAEDEAARKMLFEHACQLGKQRGAAHVELRHVSAQMANIPTKQHKVSMMLELPEKPETLWDGFKAKLRSQIRKPQKENLKVRLGGEDELEGFYHVFAINMRDLGTPVYPIKFFANILAAFPRQAHICTIFLEREPVASGFVFGFRNVLEIPWASSLREYNALAPNMLLYWSVLEFAMQQGYRQFDFGRSTMNEGTYKFKEQWGAKPLPLHWQYWLANGGPLPEINPHNPKYQFMIRTWQKLPVGVTRLLGPAIVKNIP